MRTKLGRVTLGLAGCGLLLLFQNFTYDKNSDPRAVIFAKGTAKKEAQKKQVAKTEPAPGNELQGLAREASAYADFVGLEDVRHMSDAEIVSRVSDSMFTSVEVMKMENARGGKAKSLESIARALEKDPKLQRMVIATIRENARRVD